MSGITNLKNAKRVPKHRIIPKKRIYGIDLLRSEVIMSIPGIVGGYYFDRDLDIMEAGVLVLARFIGGEIMFRSLPYVELPPLVFKILPTVLPSIASYFVIGHDMTTALGVLAGNVLAVGASSQWRKM